MDSIGRPPQQYNPNVHGPYNPGTYYGKADTHWKNVKLAELPAWLNRRSKHPVHIAQAIGRAAWRWNNKWLDVKRPTAAPLVHIIICSSAFYYFLQYKSHTDERIAKYH